MLDLPLSGGSTTDTTVGAVTTSVGSSVKITNYGIAAGVLNHPANGVAWLADRLAAQGEFLDAGEVVLAGSFTRPVDITKGDTFHADYGQFGSVSCQFV